jgi:RNA polymerase sigma factor (sigma-70 family)
MACQTVVEIPLLPGSLQSVRALQVAPSADPTADRRDKEVVSAARGRELLERHLDLIQQRLAIISRRSGLPDHEVEELRSWVLFKFVENDCRILASWKGRSSFSTYLTVVLVNLMRDYRIQVWGKWRSSAAALKQGSEIVLLEKLWVRDGLPLDEVIDRMRTEHGVCRTAAELERIASGLPRRTQRRRVSEEELRDIPVDGRVEARVEDRERSQTAARLQEVLLPLLRTLPAEECLLFKLHYWDGLSMAAISPLLGRRQRELYSVRDRCLKRLRQALEGAGLGSDCVSAVTGCSIWKPEPEDGGILE